MSPTSEDIEQFHDRVKAIDTSLAKLKGGELRSSEIIEALANVAREWLRVSPEIRNLTDSAIPLLDTYDAAMVEVLNSTKQRARASAIRSRLRPFTDGFLNDVVLPLMRFEGSPSQAASRQLVALFSESVSGEEFVYIQEAAKCSSVHCHRAAIIMLWAAAISRLHTAIQSVGFAMFNKAVTEITAKKGAPYNRVTKGLTIASLAELQRTRDADIITVGLELWKYDLQNFEEQDRLLSIRNSAAHPGMFQPVALDVRQFAEKLRRHVFDVVR